MGLSNAELLQKANLLTTGFGGAGQAPLSIQQVDQFLVVAIQPQVMLPDVTTVKSMAAKWQESVIDFNARIARPGTELTRNVVGDRVVPGTGIVEISTVLIRGEVPVSDEVMEDNVEHEGFGTTLQNGIAGRFGFDIEDLFINGDIASGDTYLALQDGWLKQAKGAGGHVYDATADGQDYQAVFKKLLNNVPDRHKRGMEVDWRYYVPKRLEEKYRDILAARGTPLGDLTLTGGTALKYQGIQITGVPGINIVAGSPDKSNILLTNRLNLYAGYRRSLTLESFRDPREGGTSFIVTARVNSKVAVIDATAIATNVDVTV